MGECDDEEGRRKKVDEGGEAFGWLYMSKRGDESFHPMLSE